MFLLCFLFIFLFGVFPNKTRFRIDLVNKTLSVSKIGIFRLCTFSNKSIPLEDISRFELDITNFVDKDFYCLNAIPRRGDKIKLIDGRMENAFCNFNRHLREIEDFLNNTLKECRT